MFDCVCDRMRCLAVFAWCMHCRTQLHDKALANVCLQIEFLGVAAPPSALIPLGASAMAQPINYSHRKSTTQVV